MKQYYKILQVLTILLFFSILITPEINNIFGVFAEIEGKENRSKEIKPEFNISDLDEYTKNYDTYYTDNFNLRQNYISIINQLDFNVFDVSPVPNRVIVGKNGWFYATKSTSNYKGANVFSKPEMEHLKAELESRSLWAKRRGIEYYLVLVPNKMNIYPENLPNHIIKISDSTRYDQVVELDQDSVINIIDLRRNILKHKSDGIDLYQHTDDHWNELGAYYGYEEIISRLSLKFPELMPIPLSSYKISKPIRPGNMTTIIGVEKDYSEEYIRLTETSPVNVKDGIKRGYTPGSRINPDEFEIVKINEDGVNLKCLVIRDSFTKKLIRFFQQNFKETIYIHDDWLYRMREDIIEIEKPDIVLNIILETELNKILINSFVKTVDIYYHTLTTDTQKKEKMAEKAYEQGLSVDKMTKLTALWLFNDQKAKGNNVVETKLYFEFLYETDPDYQQEVEAYSTNKGISFESAAKELAKEAYKKSRG